MPFPEVRTGATTGNGSSATPTVNAPTTMYKDDWLYVIINHNNETLTNTDNNGIALTLSAGEFGTGVGGGGFSVFYRKVTPPEPATYTYTMSGSDRWTVGAFAIGGGDPLRPFDVAPVFGQTENSTTTPTCPGVGVLRAGSLSIAVAAVDNAASGVFTAGPAGWTQICQDNNQQPISIYYTRWITPGATGDQDFTISLAAATSYTLKIFTVAPKVTHLRRPLGLQQAAVA